MKKLFSLPEFYLGLVLLFALLLYLLSITPDSFGFYHDDGIYVVTAKALASEQGYRIISLPGEPVQLKSPPFHPLLLSIIWRLNPNFPENLRSMMLLSALATVSSLGLMWIYFTRFDYASKWKSILIVGLVALNWRTVILASGIYVESFYSLFSITALYLAEKYEKAKGNWLEAIGLGSVLGIVFLTRTSGIALISTIAVYYLFRKKFQKVLFPLFIASLFIICWVVWSYKNKTPMIGVNSAYFESYIQTLSTVINDAREQTGYPAILIFFNILFKNAIGLLATIPLVCLGTSKDYLVHFGYAAFFAVIGFKQCFKREVRLLHLYIILYIALHLIWPYRAYDRFLMPLLPFLLLYFIQGIESISTLIRNELTARKAVVNSVIASFVGLTIISVIIIGFINYSQGVWGTLNTSRSIRGNVTEDTEPIQWINKNTKNSDVLVCYRDPLYYLYTGRKAARSSLLKEGGSTESSRVSEAEKVQSLFRIISENNAGYLILTSSDFEFENNGELYRESCKKLIEQNREIFDPVFIATDERSVIYKILEGTK